MLEAMLYRVRVGCPWRDLPGAVGPWSSVYTRWRRWNLSGLWPRMLDLLAEAAVGTLRPLDATHIKVHQDAANPAAGQSFQAIGRTKGGLNTKLTALVDASGRALQLALAPGNQADVKAAEALWAPRSKRVVADKGYDSDAFRAALRAAGAASSIPPRSNRTTPAACHRGYYRLRHQVENFFQRLKRWRAVNTRYDKLDLHFLASVQLVAILDWLLRRV
jgi:transposase